MTLFTLLLLFLIVSLTLSQTTINVNNAATSGVTTLDQALASIDPSGSVTQYKILIAPSSTTYIISNAYNLTGKSITFQTSASAYVQGSYLTSQSSCSSVPSIALNGSVITADIVTFNGILFYAADNYNNSLALFPNGVTFSDVCFQFDATIQYSQQETEDNEANATTVSVTTAPNDASTMYLIAVQGNQTANIVLQNAYLYGQVLNPFFLWAQNMSLIQFTSVSATSFPIMSASGASIDISTLTINGISSSQSNPYTMQTTNPCLAKMSYYSTASLSNVQILNLKVNNSPYFLCLYEVSPPSTLTTNITQQSFQIDTFNFQNNNFSGVNAVWSFVYFRVLSGLETSQQAISLTNINIQNNTVSPNNTFTWYDSFVFVIYPAGNITIQNMAVTNNTNLKIVSAAESNYLVSNLAQFQNCSFLSNTWNQGSTVLSFTVNPVAVDSGSANVTIFLYDITFVNNIDLVNFFSLSNQEIYDATTVDAYVWPRAWLYNANISNNVVNTSVLFGIQGVNIDFNDTVIYNNTWYSSEVLQSTSSAAPMQINNVTVDMNSFDDSSIVEKHFDTSTIAAAMFTKLVNNTTPVAYSLYVNGLYICNSKFSAFSAGLRVKGAPLLFVTQSEFTNSSFTGSSTMIYAYDLLSLIENILMNADVVVNQGYLTYLSAINDANLTQAYYQSIPISNNTLFDLGYATGNLTNGLVWIYRVYQCTFENLYFNTSDLLELDTVLQNQSLVSVDQNTFTNVTLQAFDDCILQSTSIMSMNFANNVFTQLAGLGTIVGIQSVQFMTLLNNQMTNNLGTSLLRLNSDKSYNVLLQNNTAQDIQSQATYISLEIEKNYGQIMIFNNTFDNFYIVADPTAYRQLNFLLIDTETSGASQNDIPDVYISGCSFTNSVILKNHSLIKEYQNSYLSVILAEDLFRIQDTTFNNISICYDSNLLMAVSENFEIINSSFTNIQNFQQYGSVYILAMSVLIDSSTFINNNSPVGNGGAIFLDFDSVIDAKVTFILQNSNFENNAALLGSVFYYIDQTINFTATNNTFTDNIASGDGGAMINLGYTTFSQMLFEQNTVAYTKDAGATINLFNFDYVTATEGATLNINNLNISVTEGLSGNLLSISNTDAEFVMTNLSVYGNPVLNTSTTNSFSILRLFSGSVLLQSANINNISSTGGTSLFYIACDGEANAQLEIQDSMFSNFYINSDGDNEANGDDSAASDADANMGVLHMSSTGTKTTCNNSLVVNHTTFELLNYEEINDGTLIPSVIMVDYAGHFIVNVQDSVFQNVNGIRGPVMTFVNTQANMSHITITNNTMANITSYMDGGAIYNTVNNLTLTGNQFINTSSLQSSGAAIFTNGPLDKATVLASNTFTNVTRYANYSFNDSNPLGSSPITINLTFEAPSYIIQSTVNQIPTLSNFSTTDLPDINLTTVLLDVFNQVVYDTSTIEDNSKELSVEIDGQYADSRLCQYGDCQLFEPNIDLDAYAGEVIQASVVYESTGFNVPTTHFNIVVRACLPGEINSSLSDPSSTPECRLCPVDTYSVFPLTDIECSRCPDNAVCLGGNQIIVDAGYWRYNTSSSNIIECTNLAACLGGFDSTCETGCIGPLCDSCDVSTRWVKSGDVCAQCPPTGRSLAILAALFLVTFGYQLWYIKCTRTSNSFFIVYYGNQVDTIIGKKIDLYMTQGMYIRLLTTYAQIIAIIMTFNLDFSQIFGDTFQTSAQAVANPSTSLFYSSTCAFLDSGLDSNYLMYYKIAYVVLAPFVKIAALYLFLLAIWKFKLTDKRKSLLYISALCIFIQEQPSCAQQLFYFLNCVQLETDGPYYMQQDLGYQCYTDTYYAFRAYLVIPCLAIYVLIVPGGLLYMLIINKYNLTNPKMRMNLGAIYNEYQPKAFFWGISLMGLKLVLMFLGSTLFNDIKTKAFSIFIALYIYYALFRQFQPYERKELFYAEHIALINFLFTVFMSIYYKDNSIPGVQWLTLVLIALMNLYVMGLLFWKVIRIYFVQIRDLVKPMWRNFRKKDVKLDINFLDENFAAEKENEKITPDAVDEMIFGKPDSKFWNQPWNEPQDEDKDKTPRPKRIKKQKSGVLGPQSSSTIELQEL